MRQLVKQNFVKSAIVQAKLFLGHFDRVSSGRIESLWRSVKDDFRGIWHHADDFLRSFVWLGLSAFHDLHGLLWQAVDLFVVKTLNRFRKAWRLPREEIS